MAGMRGHEAYEERKLYPYLQCTYGVSMRPLEAGHRTLSRLRADVYGALDVGEARPLRAALVAFDDVLVSHLREEEDVVIPLLLDLSPEAFAHYYVSDVQTLLASGGCDQ